MAEGDQTIALKGFPKDTQLTVRVRDPQGNPLKFPREFSRHTLRENCVILESPASGEVHPGRYLDYETADVDGALRPDENGEVQFLLASGGDYFLRARFNPYEEVRMPLKIETHESKTVDIQLKDSDSGARD